jgi:hypothetical protein
MAIDIVKKNPKWDQVQIARRIQLSNEGKRKGGVLSYSITTIIKYIRGR